jgi:threonine dehydratase
MDQLNPSTRSLLEVIRPTTVIKSPRLARRLDAHITIASETFQVTGSFKFRAAFNVANKVPQRRIIIASSGNFGQAIACACQMLGKSCIVVMPDSSPQVKIEAVREFGATMDLIDTRLKPRHVRVAELGAETPDAYVASAYDDLLVLEGNATLGAELAALNSSFDFILAPVGGGGLTSGIITGLRSTGNTTRVIGVEPATANDAARSLRAGYIIANAGGPSV